MSAFQPFAFEREFHLPLVDSSSSDEALGEALRAAEARGFAAGEAAALERLRGERSAAIVSTLNTLLMRMDDVEQACEQSAAGLERDAASLALSAAELLAGQCVENRLAGAIEQALGRILAELRRGLPVTVWVHPDLVPDVEQLVADRQRGERRQRVVVVKSDAALAPGDGRVGWDQGSALIDAAARRGALDRALADLAVGS